MAARRSSHTFEKHLNELEQLVEQMEGEELSLEESLKCFEQGIKLTRQCQKVLDQAEQKVKVLIAENETLREADFDAEDDDDIDS